MGTTRKYCLQAWHCVTSPCKSCKKPSVKRYSARSRRAFFLSRAPQCGQTNSTVSCCGSRSRAAQPVRRTPTVSRLCRPIGASLRGSTSTKNKMHQGDTRIQDSVTYSFKGVCQGFEGQAPLFAAEIAHNRKRWELVATLGVQGNEDARNLTSLRARRRSPGDLEQPPGNRRRKILCSSVLWNRRGVDARRKNCGGVRCRPSPEESQKKNRNKVLDH